MLLFENIIKLLLDFCAYK